MLYVICSILFVLGSIIGSFLNVVIFRYNTGANLRGRSKCLSCGKQIKWYDLVPVWSYFVLRGKCRFCRSRFSVEYTLVELATGLLFSGVFWKFFIAVSPQVLDFGILLSFVLSLVIMSILVVIFVYDFKHKIIPDQFILIFCLLSLLNLFYYPSLNFSPFLLLNSYFFILPLLAGPAVALPLFLIWFFSKGRAMGFGDPKLALGIGWFLGMRAGFSALILSFWFGAFVGLSLIGYSKLIAKFPALNFLKLRSKKLTMKSEVPFGPFLILGLLAVYFFGVDII